MGNIREVASKLQDIRDNGPAKLLSTGSHSLDKRMKLVKGFSWYIGGQPYHGKSEVVMELLINWSKLYGWKHYCYFGEGGELENIIADLSHKYIGKPYYKTIHGHMSESERAMAEQFIDEHFFFQDPHQDFSYKQLKINIAKAELVMRCKFDTVTVDPFNDMDYDTTMNITYWLKDVLKDARNEDAKHNRITIFVVHIGDTPSTVDKETGIRHSPPALPTEWEVGKIWNRRGMTQIGIWKDLQGNTQLLIHKVKPKFARQYSADNSEVIWTWDWKRNRYTEDIDGYKRDIIGEKTLPSPVANISGKDFETFETFETDELPF
jgi:hypothetical protein